VHHRSRRRARSGERGPADRRPGFRFAARAGLLAALCALGGALAPATPATQPPQKPEELPPPQELPALTPRVAPPPAPCPADLLTLLKDAQPINLPVALRLAETANLDIAQARELANRARAALQRAQVLALPNLNVGSTYARHEGNIAKTEGNIIKANKDSLFVGGGPSVSLAINEAIFAPLVGRQLLNASVAGVRRVNNDTLLQVAEVYLNVLRARRRLARVEETLDYLTSERASPMRAGSKGLLPLVLSYQEAGAAVALKAEVERVRVEVLRRQEERVAAVQDFLTTSAELSRLLRLDPAIPLWPLEDFRFPIPLAGEVYACRPLPDLVGFALNNRPEMAENQALVVAAVQRVRTAQWRPLLPTLTLNYNWGDFGGGPDPNVAFVGGRIVTAPGFGPSGQLHHFNTRSDFDVTLLWRLQNLGLGNLAEVREQQAAARQQSLRLLQIRDQVIAQVVQSLELTQGWRQRVGVTRAALFDAAGRPDGPVFRSLRLNFQRIREVPQTRPLEVLDAIRGLNELLEVYASSVTDYERAQFLLVRALGLPGYALFEAAGGAPSHGATLGAPIPVPAPPPRREAEPRDRG
jgi:outer membrane protein TolC